MGVYNSDTTLGDLNRLDRDNFNHINYHNAKTYRFGNLDSATKFIAQCIKKALDTCGVKLLPGQSDKLEADMEAKNIKVEHRAYPPEEKLYMSGWFIYDQREIAAFISNPFVQGSKIAAGGDFYVKTTVKGVF